MVAQFVRIKIIAPYAGAKRSDQGADFLARQHLVEPRALNVQNLAAQRQHRLIFAIARLFGRAAGGIALDNEQFRFRRIPLLTVRQLAGQRGDIQRRFSTGQLSRLARGLARCSGFSDFLDDALGVAGVFLKPRAEAITDGAFDNGPHL